MENKIVVGIPAFNEQDKIAGIILKLKKITDEIIVCDDGSTDMTSEIVENLGVKLIKHKKNEGYGSAIGSLFHMAKTMNADIFVTIDADGQHDVNDINRLIEPILNKKADIVIGSRFLDKTNEVPTYRKIGIKTITGLTNKISKSQIKDAQSGFRAYNKKAVTIINPTERGMGISTEILMRASENKLSIIEIPVIISYHGNTSTHNPIFHGTSVLMSTIKFIAIRKPLTFYGIPGLVFLFIGLIFVGWALQLFSESGQIITNVALIGIGCTLIGVLLLMTYSILSTIIVLFREKENNN